MNRKIWILITAVLVVVAACGDNGAGTTTIAATGPAPVTTAPATTSPSVTATTRPPVETTSPGTVTVAPPFLGDWSIQPLEPPVSPACCDSPAVAPVSPEEPFPETGWPADGFYDISTLRRAEAPDTLDVQIRKWVLCDELPGKCSPDPPVDGVTTDPDDSISRSIELAGEGVTVVIWPLWEAQVGPPEALVGTGHDLVALLIELDLAFDRWVLTPSENGESLTAIEAELWARSDDPTFPFGPVPGFYNSITFRGPVGSNLTGNPSWMLETAEPWPPGENGVFDWWTTLEIRHGEPVVYLYANQIAG